VGRVGPWEVVGAQHPQGCASGWPCCILQQVLQLPLELLQCGLHLQNADAAPTAASPGDSLSPLGP
jgi:hypothetical protein